LLHDQVVLIELIGWKNAQELVHFLVVGEPQRLELVEVALKKVLGVEFDAFSVFALAELTLD
jgi:hypothetical protein